MRLRIQLVIVTFALSLAVLPPPGLAIEFDLSGLCLDFPELNCDETGVPGAALPTTPPNPQPEPLEATTPPVNAPSVLLMSETTEIPLGQDVILTWSSEDAQNCEATGGWSGTKPTSGSQNIGPIAEDTSYALNCSGPGGSDVAMLGIIVYGAISLQWQPPTHNVDGSVFTDLAGYKIHWGESPGDYDSELAVVDSTATQQTLILPVNTYHVMMTAINTQGLESAPSNEVRRATE